MRRTALLIFGAAFLLASAGIQYAQPVMADWRSETEPLGLTTQSTPLDIPIDEFVDLANRPMAERALHWECVVSSEWACTAEKCNAIQASVTIRLDFERGTKQRCSGSCKSYSMKPVPDGIFTDIVSSSSTYLKILNDGSWFAEGGSLYLVTFTSFGSCHTL